MLIQEAMMTPLATPAFGEDSYRRGENVRAPSRCSYEHAT